MRNIFAACAIVLAVWVSPSRADIIVGNLGATVDGVGLIAHSGPAVEQAQEFTTGSSSETLTDIVAALGGANDTFTASAELVTNDAGQPSSTVLTTLTVPTVGSAFADLTLTPQSSVILSPNTDYWLVLSATSGTGSDAYQWYFTGTSDSSLPNAASSIDNGATWGTGAGSPYLIQVDGAPAAVPEPASFKIGLAALPLFGFWFWRKQRAAKA